MMCARRIITLNRTYTLLAANRIYSQWVAISIGQRPIFQFFVVAINFVFDSSMDISSHNFD